jgi:hypothetical protein
LLVPTIMAVGVPKIPVLNIGISVWVSLSSDNTEILYEVSDNRQYRNRRLIDFSVVRQTEVRRFYNDLCSHGILWYNNSQMCKMRTNMAEIQFEIIAGHAVISMTKHFN